MFGLISLGMSFFGMAQQAGAAGKAAAAGNINAENILKQGSEDVRRKTLEMKNTIGLTKGTIGASGIKLAGSAKAYIDSMTSEYQKDIAWIKESANTRAKVARLGGQAAAAESMAGAINTGVQAAGTFNAYGRTSGWW